MSSSDSDGSPKGVRPPVGLPPPGYTTGVAPPPGVPPHPAQGVAYSPPSSPKGYAEQPAQGVVYSPSTSPKGYQGQTTMGYSVPPQPGYPPAGYPPQMAVMVNAPGPCQHEWMEGNPTVMSWVIAFGVCAFTCLPCGFIAPLVMRSRVCIKCGYEIDK